MGGGGDSDLPVPRRQGGAGRGKARQRGPSDCRGTMFADIRCLQRLMHGVAWASGPGDRSASRVIDVQETMDAAAAAALGNSFDPANATVIDAEDEIMIEDRMGGL